MTCAGFNKPTLQKLAAGPIDKARADDRARFVWELGETRGAGALRSFLADQGVAFEDAVEALEHEPGALFRCHLRAASRH